MIRSFFILTRFVTLCFLIVISGAASSFAAVGINLNLISPKGRLTTLDVVTPDQVGLTNSAQPRLLLDMPAAKKSLSYVYDQKSELLIFHESRGYIKDYAVPLAVAPAPIQRRAYDREMGMLFQRNVKDAQIRRAQESGGGLLEFEIPIKTPKMIKSIIGEGGAGLKVNGYRKISFGGRSQWDDGVASTSGQSKFPSLQMEQVSSFQISGTIGSKIFVDVNQDSKRQESLANRIQLRYKGSEDDIVKTIELGNTNLSLPSTRFSGYSQQIQGLFGVKTTAEIGGLRLTGIASQEKSSNKSNSFRAGAESSSRIIRDWSYIDNQYFDLTQRSGVRLSDADLVAGDTITKIAVYVFTQENLYPGVVKKYGTMYVDPFDSNFAPREEVSGYFMLYGAERANSRPEDLYTYHKTNHYILFNSRVDKNTPFGVVFEYVHWDIPGDPSTRRVITVGSEGTTSDPNLKLKCIQTISPQPTYVTWDYVWRNVYDVGRVDDPDAFEVDIYKGSAQLLTDNRDSDLNHQNGVFYISMLGLDRNNDGKVDAWNQDILDPGRGHLRILDPDGLRRPFDYSGLNERVKTIYDSAIDGDRQDSTKYYLIVKSASRASNFFLGNFDIVPGSESVTLNGTPLKKDVDYQIQYETGSITFLNQDALSANSDVKVDYEYAPVIQSTKKTLLGVRGEYEFSRNFKVGAMALYKSEKETDRKPKLGEEQAKFLNLDVDASYSFETNTLTQLVNLLPFVNSKQTSRVAIQGEIGQSMPNPNVKGEASIDDFEGSEERTSIGVTRNSWFQMSMPAQFDTLQVGTTRGRLIWYNPFDQVPIEEIYNRETKAGEGGTTVLVMRFTPRADEFGNTLNSVAGIMKPFSKSAYDQSKTRFVEIRMKGEKGVLHLDLGIIAEDINGDRQLQTEDNDKDGYIDKDFKEDRGLDLLSDAEERALCDSGDAPFWYDCQAGVTDPAGDNWSYSSSGDQRDNYERINGTEKNAEDLSNSKRPDTEDLNRDGYLEVENDYFTWSMDLANNPYRVAGSERNGWYTVRIPFQDSLLAGHVRLPEKNRIQSIRLWMDSLAVDGDSQSAFVQIADIEMTRNVWEARPILPLEKVRSEDTRFEVTVISTEKDSARYTSPPGVEGFYDKTTQLREREQSLRFNFENLAPGDTAYAENIPFRQQDLSGYNKLEMWLHGDSTRNNLLFFYRFGPDSKNYYEYRTVISQGWDAEHSVKISFEELTQVKLKLNDLRIENPDTNEYSEGRFRVFGNPSITRVKYYSMGITNTDSLAVDSRLTGDIWIDEMRATEVRRDKGLAGYVSGSMTFGDIASLSASYSRQDEFFRTLTQADRRDLGSGSKSTNYGYNVTFNVDKFLPPTDAASIPFSYNWSRSELSPRLITGSDIVVPDERIEAEKSISTNSGFSISERFNKRTNNLLYTLFLNKFQSNFSYRKAESITPLMPESNSEDYNAKGQYTISSPARKGVRLFAWLSGLPLVPKRVASTEFNPIPARVSFSADVNRTQSYRRNNFNVETSSYTRTLRGTFDAGANPLTGWDVSYRMATDRDISDPNQLRLSFNPKSIWLGKERRYDEAFNLNYSPNILPFITGSKLSFASAHGENFNTDQQGNLSIVRRVSNSRTLTAGTTFNLQKLIGQHKSTSASRKTPVVRPTGKGAGLDSLRKGAARDSVPASKPAVQEPGTPIYAHGLRFIHFFTDRIDPVALSYKWDERMDRDGFISRPDLWYRLGFSSDPGVDTIVEGSNAANRSDAYSKGRTYSARSGVRMPLGISVGSGWAYSITEGSNRQTIDHARTWPDLSFKFGKLDWLQVPKLFSKNMTLDSKYSEKTSWQFNSFTRQTHIKVNSTDFAPLVSVGFDWKFANGLRSSLSFNKSLADKRQYRDGQGQDGELTTWTKDYINSVSVRTSYSFRGGSNFWLPLFGKIKIQSNLTLDLDVSQRNTRTENFSPVNPDSFTVSQERSEFTVQPAATYNFSTNIKGGMRGRWSDSKDRVTNRHVRELEFWVEIRF